MVRQLRGFRTCHRYPTVIPPLSERLLGINVLTVYALDGDRLLPGMASRFGGFGWSQDPDLGRYDGTIYTGANFLRRLRESDALRWPVLQALIAYHECGHIHQFATDFDLPGPALELHADAMAGYCLALGSIDPKGIAGSPAWFETVFENRLLAEGGSGANVASDRALSMSHGYAMGRKGMAARTASAEAIAMVSRAIGRN